ncbi:MAG: hypothetical protein Greene101447_500 [Parcubacteria group bacterium Greene1014_47]|nr:MAG: hypothetical protein Greene101447_500 [Parcubacteria group bacterium Greene1014_47]
MRKKYLIPIVGICLILLLSIIYLGSPKAPTEQVSIIKEQPTATACRPLYGQGKQTYDVLTDNPQNPQIVQVEVDPIDVQEGQTQTVTVKVKDKDNNTITKESSVLVKILLDNTNLAAALKLVKAEDVQENSTTSFLTTWKGSWVKEDTTCHTYTETITARNSKGEESFVDLSLK